MKKFVCALGAGLLACCLSAPPAQANVLISGTRVVFPAKDGEVTVRLTNDNDHPVLVESWIDRGDMHSTPESVDVPFLITPPLFRMEAKKDQSLRIVFTHEQLPDDRESLFWLNVLEVPPKPSGPQAAQNLLQLALRSRLKLFYRPAALAGSPIKAPGSLSWKVVSEAKGYALEAHNPTPYFITISGVSVSGPDGKPDSGDTGMIAPMSDLRLHLHDAAYKPVAGDAVAYTIINDFGGSTSFKGVIAP